MTSKNNQTKGQRTERLLKDVGLDILVEQGFHDLKVTDVSKRAGLSAGVFYIYFKSKEELVSVIFDELIKGGVDAIFDEPSVGDAFDAILETNRRYVALLHKRGGLARALFQIIDQLPEAREQWRRSNSAVARKIASAIDRRTPGSIGGENARVVTALAAQAMLDTMLMNTLAFDDPDMREMAEDPERFSQVLSILWYKMLYGKSPPREKCPDALDFLPVIS